MLEFSSSVLPMLSPHHPGSAENTAINKKVVMVVCSLKEWTLRQRWSAMQVVVNGRRQSP